MAEHGLEIAVECIECGQGVCIHQQAVIRRLEEALDRYQRVARSPWSFHRGSLRERLEWCRDQHAYAAEHPPPAPMEREAKQDFDRACVVWYDEMLGQLAEDGDAYARAVSDVVEMLRGESQFTSDPTEAICFPAAAQQVEKWAADRKAGT